MSSLYQFLLFSFLIGLWPRVACAESYVLGEFAFVEPEEGIVKSVYKSNIYNLGLGYGFEFDSGAKLESHVSRREYRSRLNALESNMRMFEIGGDVLQVLSHIPNWFDFFIGFGAKLIAMDVTVEDESTDTKTTENRTTSFAYQYQFGGEIPWPALRSIARLAIIREHIYKEAFGNFSLDGHLYEFTWIYKF
jgi:hypothetical protein